MSDEDRKQWSATEQVLSDITSERRRQVAKWGVQHRPEFKPLTSLVDAQVRELTAKALCDYFEKKGPLLGYTGGATWEHILDEEYAEALAETDPIKRRKELVECAAVIVAWIEDLDRA